MNFVGRTQNEPGAEHQKRLESGVEIWTS